MNPHNAPDRMAEGDYRYQDPGAGGAIAPSGQWKTCGMATAAAETRSLADPRFVGQRFTMVLNVDGGNCVVTATSPINQTGNTIMTFEDAKDSIDLYAISDGSTGYEWRVAANNGVTLS